MCVCVCACVFWGGELFATQVYLYIINIIYVLVGLLIIGVASAAIAGSYIHSIGVLSSVMSTGVLLLFVSLLGIVATCKRSHPALLAYIILLALLFIIQVAISGAALGVDEVQTRDILRSGWCALDNADKGVIQRNIPCFGFDGGFNSTGGNDSSCMAAPVEPDNCPATCATSACAPTEPLPEPPTTPCAPCYGGLSQDIQTYLKRGGGVGLGFAFTELLGIWAAINYRRTSRQSATYRGFL